MQPRDFFVQFFWQTINANFVRVAIFPQIQLRENLIRKTVRHNETWMTGGATEIHQPTFREQINCVVVRQNIFVHLRFDVDAFDVFRRVNLST
jgi:hypothetical protein